MRRASDAVQALLKSRLFYPVVWLACAYPLAHLLYRAAPVLIPAFAPDVTVPWDGDLGVNATKTLLHETGRDALGFLFYSLCITPLRRLTGWNRLQTIRRTLGVWSFVYALAHLSVYVVFDQVGDFSAIAEDVLTRKFIFLGMFTFTILLALTATSTNGMIRRLKKRWQTLHRLVYVAGVTGVVHFAWGQKADIREPLQWGAFLMLLLGYRVYLAWRKHRQMVVQAVSR